MDYVQKLAFKAAMGDLWRDEDADPDAIFARQGLAIVSLGKGGVCDEKVHNRIAQSAVDMVEAGLRDLPTRTVKEAFDEPAFDAIEFNEAMRVIDEIFDE